MRNEFQGILLTGGSGQLGSAIIHSGAFKNLKAPSRRELDITEPDSIRAYLKKNRVDAVIHAAAIARMSQCEKDPAAALSTNAIGTALLVKEILNIEKLEQRNIRFVYISTDGVYESTKGNYAEDAPTIPYNKYGWSKLAGECAVRILPDHCIVRTRFFDQKDLKFDSYATDSFTSSLPVENLMKALGILIKSDFVGAINVGGTRESDFDRFKKIKSSIRPCTLKDIYQYTPFRISQDASLKLDLWEKLKKELSGA